MDKILINAADPEECRVAILHGGQLEDYYTDSSMRELTLHNIYKGVIQNIEPSLGAVFVNYGGERNGFLQLGDIHPEYFLEEPSGRGAPDLKRLLQKGQPMLVQIQKDPSELKGAALTTYISLPGRFVVLTPGREHTGVSRKIESDEERRRLKKIAEKYPVPEGCGYIVRTVAEGRTAEELGADLAQVYGLWEDIRRQGQLAPAPALIYKEQDLAVKTIRDYFTNEVKEILVDDPATFKRVREYIGAIAPKFLKAVKLHREKRPIFAKHQIEEQTESIFQARVRLKSGGSIIITPTEAMVSIDVNSGRGTREANLEETALNTNLEAAEEVARQLRLRDLGGLIVIDFIDMRDEKHRRELEKKLKEATKNDKAKIDIARISKFGLVEMSRQRLRPSLESGHFESCPYCQGRGLIRTPDTTALTVLRLMSHSLAKGTVEKIECSLHPDVAHYLLNNKRLELARLEERYQARISVSPSAAVMPGSWEINFVKRPGEGSLENGGEAASGEPAVKNGRPFPAAAPAAAAEPGAEAAGLAEAEAAGVPALEPGEGPALELEAEPDAEPVLAAEPFSESASASEAEPVSEAVSEAENIPVSPPEPGPVLTLAAEDGQAAGVEAAPPADSEAEAHAEA